MAGILANSASVSMVSGDTATSKNMFGYAKAELITLGVTPAGSSWVWALVPPSASLARTARLSSGTAAAPTFTPDVDGTYAITCMVDGTTSYTIHCVVVNETTAVQVPHVTWSPKAPADVVKPAGGLRQFYNSETGLMAFKDSDGNVSTAVVGTSTGSPVGIVPGATATAGSTGLASDAGHGHAVPAFGTTAATFCQGNDSRLPDSSLATGLAGAAAGQVVVAQGGGKAAFQTGVPTADSSPAFATHAARLASSAGYVGSVYAVTADGSRWRRVAAGAGADKWEGMAEIGRAFFAPTGTANDGPAFLAALVAERAGLQRIVTFLPDRDYYFTEFTLGASGDNIHLNGATIHCNITGHGGHDDTWYRTEIPSQATAVTLAADVAEGAKSISVTSAVGITTGTVLDLGWGPANRSTHQTFKVASEPTGTGPYTVDLDRPTAYAFPIASSTCWLNSITEDVHIKGPATFTGTVTRYVEMIACWHSTVEDLTFVADDGIASACCFSWDNGCYDCWGKRNRIAYPSGSSTQIGFFLESGDFNGHEFSHVNGVANGFAIEDSAHPRLLWCTASNCTNGAQFFSQENGSGGATDSLLFGCTFRRAPITINEATRTTIAFCDLGASIGTYDVNENAPAAGALGAVGVEYIGNVHRGLGSQGAITFATSGIRNLTGVALAPNPVGHAWEWSQPIWVVAANMTINMLNCTYPAAGAGGIKLNSTSKLNLYGCTELHRSSGEHPYGYGWIGVYSAVGAVVSVTNHTATGTGLDNIGIYLGTARIGSNNNWGSVATPYNSTTNSIGTVTLNGTTPVDYSFPGLRADPDDPVTLTRTTAGGTAQSALPPTITKTTGASGKVSVVSATVNADDIFAIKIG